MKKTVYPILKETVRISNLKNFCWITELFGDFGAKCTAKQAFIAALCNGTNDLETVVAIYAGVFRLKEEEALDYVENTLNRYKICFDFSEEEVDVKRSVTYEPADFIYHLGNEVIETRNRMESPVQMTIVLTRTCNFKCIYCYNDSSCSEKIEMTTEDWEEVIEQAREIGIVKCTITGGEPLTHPGFFQILRKLEACGIITYICTNGSLIDDAAIEKFLEIGTKMVQISLDSPIEQIHDELTVSKGTFSNIVNNIKKLVKAGIKVYVKAIMIPNTFKNVGELIELCHDMGVSNLVLDQYDLCYAGRGDNRFFLSKEQQQFVLDTVEEKKKQIHDMNINAILTERAWKDKDAIVMCGAFTNSIIIVSNGDYAVCEKLAGVESMTVGNFKEMSIEEMWKSPKIQEIMNPSLERIAEPCKSCECLPACNTGCFATKQFFTDDLYAVDPRCWKAKYEGNPFVTV